MKPTDKSPEITKFLETVYGRTHAIENDKCIDPPIGCGKPIVRFDDELSEREYRISGLCQECQNRIFIKE